MSNVFLDLEGTIIDGWNSGLLINPNKIKIWLDSNNIGDIHIFSFALYNNKDLVEFVDSGMKNSIERALNRRILTWPSVEDIQKVVYDYEHVRYENVYEFSQINGKHWAFIKFILGQQEEGEFVLIDDTIPSLEIKDNKGNKVIRLINIVDI
jgi:hypothetical protein